MSLRRIVLNRSTETAARERTERVAPLAHDRYTAPGMLDVDLIRSRQR